MEGKNPDLLSHKPIEIADLQRLQMIARTDREDFFRRHQDWARLYAKRMIAVALCQGGALHYLDPSHGLNDFDVYTFYAANPARNWYAKRIKQVDFADPKFGRSEIGDPEFVGRRVDLLGRALDVEPDENPIAAILSWLKAGRGKGTPAYLRQKAVVLLEPEHFMGTIVWPINGMRRLQT